MVITVANEREGSKKKRQCCSFSIVTARMMKKKLIRSRASKKTAMKATRVYAEVRPPRPGALDTM